MPNFTQNQLQKITTDIFEAGGVPGDEAEIIGELLVASNLTGHDFHGVLRIPQYIGLIESGLIQPGATMEIERESASHALINGNWGFGHVIPQKAMSLAIEKAKSNAISAISVYNCNHIGRIGSYPLMAAEAGMVGITMVNAGGTALYVAPFGGRDGRLTTNPIAIATPARDTRFCWTLQAALLHKVRFVLPLIVAILCRSVGSLTIKANRPRIHRV